MRIFSCLSLPTPKVSKSVLLAVAGTVATIQLWNHRRTIGGYVAIGPYPSVFSNWISRALQRATINMTREDVRVDWHPLHSQLQGEPSRSQDNGHAKSGAARDASRWLISNAVMASGRTRFEISPSGHAVNDRDYVHQHYAVNDLHTGVRFAYPSEDNVVVGIDVDYYLNDPSDYLGFPVPAIFYTFQPTVVSGSDAGVKFRVVNNNIHYDVSGGNSWVHEIWDWCVAGEFVEFYTPRITPISWVLSLVGLRKVCYQKVHHARPWVQAPHRALVWCLPQFTTWRWTWINTDMHVRKLKRVDFRDKRTPGWNSIISLDNNEELRISIGRENEDASVSLNKADFDVLMGLQSAQSVTTRMIGMDYRDPGVLALVGQYFRKGVAEVPGAARLVRPLAPLVHWPMAAEVEAAEASFRTYGAPLVSDANMVPMIKRWEVMSLSLDRRVDIVRNSVTPDKRFQRYAEEFLDHVCPISQSGVPYDLERTAELLDKPSQVLAVQQIWETGDAPARRLIESFVKNEPTNKAGRIISSFPDMRYLLGLSRFTLAFRDKVLHAEHNKHWFCPGLTPPEIAAKVVDYCSLVEQPIEGDFSNFDGSVSEWAQRHVMNAAYLHFFRPENRLELAGLLDLLVKCPARAKRFGFQYDAGVGVKSGSPTTCDANTILNAFLQYCAIRLTCPYTPTDIAFRQIGLAFGDDSLFERQFATKFQFAAERLGMQLKVEVCLPDQGVTFLARVFPNPTATTTSFQDPLRTWRKLHLTCRDPNISLATASVDRLEGYLATDAYTPVTAEYARMIIRNYSPIAETLEKRRARKSVDKEKPYWLTVGGAWPQDPDDSELMLHCISARTGFDVEALRMMQQTLVNLTDPWSTVVTFNRDEEPSPYVDTLDADAQPATGWVDHRIMITDKNDFHARANGKGDQRRAKPSRDGGEVVESSSPAKSGATNNTRYKRVRGIPGGDAGKAESRNDKPADKTSSVAYPPRGHQRSSVARRGGRRSNFVGPRGGHTKQVEHPRRPDQHVDGQAARRSPPTAPSKE
nr:MAG: RNA-dependent RNA polymerase [Sichuan forest noda-like virus 6]